MKMKAIKYIGAAAVVALAVACSNDDDGMDAYFADPNAVRINAVVGEGIPVTRSYPTDDDANQGKFKPGDAVAVTSGSQAPVTYTLQAGGTTWTPATDKYLKWEEDQMVFHAYYPAPRADGQAVNNASLTTFTVPTDQSTLDALEKADYMIYAEPEPIAKGDNNVTLQLERKTARVIVHISGFNTQYETGYEVTKTVVHGNTTGYESSQPAAGDISVNSYRNGEVDFYALLAPTTASADVTFLTLTVKPVGAAGDVQGDVLTVKGIPALEAGHSYTYNITVGKDLVRVNSVTVSDWGNENTIGDGNAEIAFDMEQLRITSAEEVVALLDKYVGDDKTLAIVGNVTPENMTVLHDVFKDKYTYSSYVLDMSNSTLTQSLQEEAFGAFKLKGIILPNNLAEIDKKMFFDSTIEYVTFPTSLKTIGESIFMSCFNLKHVNLDETQVTSIPLNAFYNCSALGEIALGKVTSIGMAAFYGCDALERLDLSKCTQVPSIDVSSSFSTFKNVNVNNLKVYVKDEDMKTAFTNDDNWKTAGFAESNFIVKPQQ